MKEEWKKIAKLFNVDRSTIGYIIRKVCWKHLTGGGLLR